MEITQNIPEILSCCAKHVDECFNRYDGPFRHTWRYYDRLPWGYNIVVKVPNAYDDKLILVASAVIIMPGFCDTFNIILYSEHSIITIDYHGKGRLIDYMKDNITTIISQFVSEIASGIKYEKRQDELKSRRLKSRRGY